MHGMQGHGLRRPRCHRSADDILVPKPELRRSSASVSSSRACGSLFTLLMIRSVFPFRMKSLSQTKRSCATLRSFSVIEPVKAAGDFPAELFHGCGVAVLHELHQGVDLLGDPLVFLNLPVRRNIDAGDVGILFLPSCRALSRLSNPQTTMAIWRPMSLT